MTWALWFSDTAAEATILQVDGTYASQLSRDGYGIVVADLSADELSHPDEEPDNVPREIGNLAERLEIDAGVPMPESVRRTFIFPGSHPTRTAIADVGPQPTFAWVDDEPIAVWEWDLRGHLAFSTVYRGRRLTAIYPAMTTNPRHLHRVQLRPTGFS